MIGKRLEGVYNYNVQTANTVNGKHRSSRSVTADAASGASETLPLSIEGHVHRLITEAVSEENLSLM